MANLQLMTWCGSSDDFWEFIRRPRMAKFEKPPRAINLYRTSNPNVFVWSKREINKSVTEALGLTLHETQTLGGNVKPKFQLIGGTAQVDPREIKLLRSQHPYFTIDRTGGYVWDKPIFGNEEEFLAQASLAEAMFIRNSHWVDLIGSSFFEEHLEAITRYDLALKGELGTIKGCIIFTDAFIEPCAKDDVSVTHVVFLPKKPKLHLV